MSNSDIAPALTGQLCISQLQAHFGENFTALIALPVCQCASRCVGLQSSWQNRGQGGNVLQSNVGIVHQYMICMATQPCPCFDDKHTWLLLLA